MSEEQTVLYARDISINDDIMANFERSGSYVPLVLIPHEAECCHASFSVPPGFYVLHERFGAYQGPATPGFVCCWPAYSKISHIVQSGTVTYSAPARKIPSSDNIPIDIDLVVEFKIPSEDSARDFVYKLGPSRLHGILKSTCAEATRKMVYSVPHNEAMDLNGRSPATEEIVLGLNQKLSQFGVQVRSVIVTKVKLPNLLEKRLERTTAFKTEIEEAEKKQENRLLTLSNSEAQKLEGLRRTNERSIQQLNAEAEAFKIQAVERRDKAKGNNEVELTKTRSWAAVKLTEAENKERMSKMEGERTREQLVTSTRTQCDKRRIETDQKANSLILQSQSDLEVARLKAEGMVESAKAELAAVESLVEKRKFELQWAQLNIMKTFAARGRKFISGEAADNLMAFITPSPEPIGRE